MRGFIEEQINEDHIIEMARQFRAETRPLRRWFEGLAVFTGVRDNLYQPETFFRYTKTM